MAVPKKTSASDDASAASALRITSKLAGFRRAGLAHPAEPTDYPAGTFTPEQIATLKGEPMLVVEEIGTGDQE